MVVEFVLDHLCLGMAMGEKSKATENKIIL
jgi:hypothetical protein